jgi:beta-lactamase class A
MNQYIFAACGLVMIFSAVLLADNKPGFHPPIIQSQHIEKQIADRIKQYSAESVGIYYEDADGNTFTHNADEVYHAASTMKIPVMMEVFHQVEQGKLKLDQPIPIQNEFKSIMDGSPFSLDSKEDGDPDFYSNIGKTVPLLHCVERMINHSSNLATNIIIELVTPSAVMDLMKTIGAKDMTVLRGVEDIKAFNAGKINSTSARALAVCLKALQDKQFFQQESRSEMFRILLTQHFLDGIPAGIKANERGLKVANKTGNIEKIAHDAAIIQDASGRNSILVILTRGVEKEDQGNHLVADIAGDIWSTYH